MERKGKHTKNEGKSSDGRRAVSKSLTDYIKGKHSFPTVVNTAPVHLYTLLEAQHIVCTGNRKSNQKIHL